MTPRPENSIPNTPEVLRAKDLMVAAALGTLSDAERGELLTIQSSLTAKGVRMTTLADEADLLIGEAIAAMAPKALGAMPAASRERLESLGKALISKPAASPVAGRIEPSHSSSGGLAGWIVAAGAAIVATLGWIRPTTTTPALDPIVPAAQQRLALLGKEGTQVIEWSTGPDPRAPEVKGDIVWNTTLQKGFLRFRSAVRNDPQREQFQLWIFDKEREQFAVDGGVFNLADNAIDPKSGDIVIPIDAKLKVFDPTLFAVTSERPAGVVVTDPKRIVVLAKPEDAKKPEVSPPQ
jgi:hypothetical protein